MGFNIFKLAAFIKINPVDSVIKSLYQALPVIGLKHSCEAQSKWRFTLANGAICDYSQELSANPCEQVQMGSINESNVSLTAPIRICLLMIGPERRQSHSLCELALRPGLQHNFWMRVFDAFQWVFPLFFPSSSSQIRTWGYVCFWCALPCSRCIPYTETQCTGVN